jgi:hypothetical protein
MRGIDVLAWMIIGTVVSILFILLCAVVVYLVTTYIVEPAFARKHCMLIPEKGQIWNVRGKSPICIVNVEGEDSDRLITVRSAFDCVHRETLATWNNRCIKECRYLAPLPRNEAYWNKGDE